MKTTTILGATLLAAFAARAENVLNLDDFKAASYNSKAIKTGSISAMQTGDVSHIVAGARAENLLIGCAAAPCSANPLNQYASFAIGVDKFVAPALHALTQSTGFYQAQRFELGYGAYAGVPMYANLAAYDRIRVDFIGLTQPLNFNILLYTGTLYGQNGCNLPAYGGAFSVEFLRSGFSQPGGTIDFSNVNEMVLIFQDSSAIGGVSYGIRSIEASDTHQAGAIECSLVTS